MADKVERWREENFAKGGEVEREDRRGERSGKHRENIGKGEGGRKRRVEETEGRGREMARVGKPGGKKVDEERGRGKGNEEGARKRKEEKRGV